MVSVKFIVVSFLNLYITFILNQILFSLQSILIFNILGEVKSVTMGWESLESLIAMDWGPCHYNEVKTVGDFFEWLYFTYCLQMGIYILDGWERIIFSKLIVLCFYIINPIWFTRGGG